MRDQDKDFLIKTLEDKAIDEGDVRAFFRSMGDAANFPKEWYAAYRAQISDNARYSAQNIVRWAIGMEINRKDPNFMTLGSLLYPIVKDFGLEKAQRLVVIIVSNRLVRKKELLTELMVQYGIPFPSVGTTGDVSDLTILLAQAQADTKIGPELDWRGPDDVQLQGFSWSQPDYMDAGFLMRATDRALAVCRISIPSKQRIGTGFLIAPTLLLTNYHVFAHPETPGDDKNANAAEAVLRFRYTSEEEEESDGHEFKLVKEQPIVVESPVPDLDFMLLRVEDNIKSTDGVKALKYKEPTGKSDQSLNIIQHPAGGHLKIAFNSNGVTGVYDDGRIQYLSKAAGGSSGSPCFNDDWNLVAIHHAERSTWSGVKREGIQFSHIYPRIKGHLQS
jgi:endonuclease G, mitochondrial